jgi:hypothetical protein
MRLFLILLLLVEVQAQFAQIIVAKEGYEATKFSSKVANKVVNLIENVCILDNNCFKSIANLNNYCCTFQCCNMISYTFRNEY